MIAFPRRGQARSSAARGTRAEGRRRRSGSVGDRSGDDSGGDSIEAAVARFADLVETVRARTSGPLVTAARALVYGFVIAVAAISAAVLTAVAAVRLLDIVVPGEVWAAHLITSALFGAVGAWAWSRRRPRAPTST